LDLARKYKEVKASIGIYPVKCLELSEKEIDSEIDFIRKNKDKIAAVGEVGIDMKESADLEKQKINFEKFILLAKELDKPVIVHSRKAEKECIEVLEKHKAKKVIMHCFFGKIILAKRIEENKWFFSIPSIIKRNEQMQELVKNISINSILCETDSPFLNPNSKTEENEPALVVEGYKKIAEIKNLSLDETRNVIAGNCKTIFETL